MAHVHDDFQLLKLKILYKYNVCNLIRKSSPSSSNEINAIYDYKVKM